MAWNPAAAQRAMYGDVPYDDVPEPIETETILHADLARRRRGSRCETCGCAGGRHLSSCGSLAAAVRGYVEGRYDVDELEVRVERALLEEVELRDPTLVTWG